MRVLLIGPDLEENLALGYLASSLERAGYDTEVQSYNGEADTQAVVKRLPAADIVGLSLSYQAKAKEYLHLAAIIRKEAPRVRVIAGGHYATCAAEDILTHHSEIDVVVLHEGEQTLVDLAALYDGMSRSLDSVPGIAFRQGGGMTMASPRQRIEDLDSLPFPKRNGKAYLLAGVPTAYVLGSRGCMNSCAYCCISGIHRLAPGKTFRQRTPQNVVREMAELYHDRGVRHFVFHDDNFLVPSVDQNRRRLAGLKEEIRRRRLRDIGLTIKCCPADVDESVFAELRAMGLVRVFLGIETSQDAVLRNLKRRQTLEQSERAIGICRALGISVQFNIMVVNPYADFASMRDDVDFMQKYVDLPLNFCRTELFAGTPLEREMIEQKRARGDYLARVYRMDSPALDRASHFFAKLFYDRCWSSTSLMLMSGGLDHLGAVLKQHYGDTRTRFIVNRIRRFVVQVNADSLALLSEMIDLFENQTAIGEPELLERLKTLAQRERSSRIGLHQLGEGIRENLARFVQARLGIELIGDAGYVIRRRGGNLPRHAMAALLALSVAGTSSCLTLLGGGVEEYAPPPLEDTDGDGLYDRYERQVFNTHVASVDSDGDRVSDADEDHDSDGITNWEYQTRQETPIIAAIRQGQVEHARAMIAGRVDDLDARDGRGGTALMAAAAIGNTLLAKAILEAGVDIDARDKLGRTALMAASRLGNHEIVGLLLSCGADVNATDNEGNTAMAIAAMNGHSQVVDLLTSAGATGAPGTRP